MLNDKIKVFQNCARINFERDGYLSPALVAESWMSSYEKDGSFVEKIEAITMTHCSKFLPYETSYYSEIERYSEDSAVLKDWIEHGRNYGSEGSFSNLFIKCSHQWN